MSALYIERTIHAPIDTLWELTQDPALHQRWDGRFGAITYEDAVAGRPQRFGYAVTVLPWRRITGSGESTGDRTSADGTRTSSLRFWSPDPLSLIERGQGFWRYEPVDGGVRFLTRYDYTVRWGVLGRCADRVWRPATGRLTAWSFDRLRLWAERRIAPEVSVVTTLSSMTCALIAVCSPLLGHPVPALVAAAAFVALDGVTPKARRCTRRPRRTQR